LVFFIEIKQDYNWNTEVTVVPPSFDYWNENLVHDSLSNLEIEIGEVARNTFPLGSYL
jgi:hypothetical protein